MAEAEDPITDETLRLAVRIRILIPLVGAGALSYLWSGFILIFRLCFCRRAMNHYHSPVKRILRRQISRPLPVGAKSYALLCPLQRQEAILIS
jgi:hypothetical protein